MGFRDLRRRLGSSWSDAPGLWDSLGAPGERDWFHACRAWIQCPEDGCLAERAAALGIVRHLTDIRSVAFLHLGIAHLVRRPPASPAVRERRLRSWADRYRLPVGAVRDLEEELRTRQLPEAKAQVVIPLLLVGTGNSEGKVADLTVALVARDGLSSEDGSQVATEAEVYHVPAQ
jgi:hypothetical protein